MQDSHSLVRTIYLYLVSVITLVMLIISVSGLVSLGLRMWVFPDADRETIARPVVVGGDEPVAAGEEVDYDPTPQRQRQAITNVSMLVVALPLFWYHFREARRDRMTQRHDATTV